MCVSRRVLYCTLLFCTSQMTRRDETRQRARHFPVQRVIVLCGAGPHHRSGDRAHLVLLRRHELVAPSGARPLLSTPLHYSTHHFRLLLLVAPLSSSPSRRRLTVSLLLISSRLVGSARVFSPLLSPLRLASRRSRLLSRIRCLCFVAVGVGVDARAINSSPLINARPPLISVLRSRTRSVCLQLAQAYIARDGAARVWMAHAFKARLPGRKSYRVQQTGARMGQAERICHAIGCVLLLLLVSLYFVDGVNV